MPVARQPVFTPMPPIRKRARHTSWRRTACGDAPLVATHRLWRRTACGDAPLVATHRLWRRTACGDAPLVATHRLWRRTACGDAPLVATHRLWRRTACGDAPLVATHRLWRLYGPDPKPSRGLFAAGRRRDRSARPPRHAMRRSSSAFQTPLETVARGFRAKTPDSAF